MAGPGVNGSKGTPVLPSARKESSAAVGLGKELIQNHPSEVSLLGERAL